MNLKQLQQSIKLSMNIITKAMKQLPQDKRLILTSRVNNVLSKYIDKDQSLQKLQKFHKQLQFNLNFVKLSHPNLDYSPSVDKIQGQKLNDNSSEKGQKKQEKDTHKFKLVNSQQIQIERLKNDTFDSQLQRQKSVRTQVQFSNWFDGNADPEQLKRHKQLLQRQHFKGEFWKDKEKPRTYARQYLEAALAQKMEGKQPPKKDTVIKDHKPMHIEQSQNVWQKVKR